MIKIKIELGGSDRVAILFSFPNNKSLGWSLEETVVHWINQTLTRDGYNAAGLPPVIVAEVEISGGNVTLVLSSEVDLAHVLTRYQAIIPKFLEIGWKAYSTVVPILKKEGRWDPRGKGWRFFLPLGLPMLNQKTLQFFHYPPIKMLQAMQDYLDDPVPHRLENLLMVNGVSDRADAQTYETIVDGAPIAAPDDEGSAKCSKCDPEWGCIPIQFFMEYQKGMVELLLHESANCPGYTLPIVVYGSHPRKIFSEQFLGGDMVKVNVPVCAEIVPGLKTWIIGANHPYNFYWTAQADSDPEKGSVGDGEMNLAHCASPPSEGGKSAVDLMQGDLITTRWQKDMAGNPSMDGNMVLRAAQAHWTNPENDNMRCALTQSQATLLYTNKEQTTFTFRVGVEDAAKACSDNENKTCSFKV
ncbi:hypothetical protein PEL8287_02302 [Roseovarius litorisediminis]|uniref:Uncharacterized protein n=1 Tax=Roseovarius litorisediminis TaxID=1312363 RepID=A0A1Y5SPT1_9RHOB|nr:hypothetical protein [Roseovarius litorisediminis]SLN45013.1 hypothetical protein PEL8287_02302 [Roseovarius litorisediminis]